MWPGFGYLYFSASGEPVSSLGLTQRLPPCRIMIDFFCNIFFSDHKQDLGGEKNFFNTKKKEAIFHPASLYTFLHLSIFSNSSKEKLKITVSAMGHAYLCAKYFA